MNKSTDKYDVFISYSRADYKDGNNNPLPNNVISKITSAFRENEISFWIDEDGILSGDNFAPQIAKAIKSASLFVFVSTKNSNSSKWTQNEICVAHQYKKPILPIKCDDSDYDVTVIMYLASLDYCDYKNSPDTSINQLVKSVKEKLPNYQSKDFHKHLKNDLEKNSAVIEMLSDINHQIVDISQITVNQIIESQERNCNEIQRLCSIVGSGIEHFSNNRNCEIERLEKSLYNYHSEIIHVSNNGVNQILSCFHNLMKRLDSFSQDIKHCQQYNLELQKQTNDLLKQLYEHNLKYLKFHNNNFNSNYDYNNICVEPYVEKHIDLFLLIDVSGSMAGKNIDAINKNIPYFINNFTNNYDIPINSEVRLSVMSYSTDAKWQYNKPININSYKWIDLEALGLTNLGKALHLLNEALIHYTLNKNYPPLIVLITDGSPTDDYYKGINYLISNDIFIHTVVVCIKLGKDAENVIDNCEEYFIDDATCIDNTLNEIVNKYLNKINDFV